MRRSLFLFAGVVLFGAVTLGFSGGATQAQPRWVITDLGTLGGKWSVAYDINDRGQIVGSSYTHAGLQQGVLWDKGKSISLGVVGSEAVGINNWGKIVGRSSSEDDDLRTCCQRALLWESGHVTRLATPKGHVSEARAINDRGEIVGWEYKPFTWSGAQGEQAVLWQHGMLRSLGRIHGDLHSEATGISGRGQIVGVSGRVPATEWFDASMAVGSGFVWTNGTVRSLDNSKGSWIFALNDRGWIVGTQGGHATVWINGAPHRLAGKRGKTVATDINERGQIVGSWSPSKDAKSHACVWVDGKFTLLPNLPGGGESDASGINERGQIVGSAWTKNGDTHAVLWTLKPG